MNRILLIDDDEEVLELNAKYFTNNGFRVAIAQNAIIGLKIINEFQPDCIVMDVMMPQMNGFTACEEIRKKLNVPVIFLTGRTNETDMINGLMLGADDYMIKPYSLKELLARVIVNIRRYEVKNVSKNIMVFPPLSIDVALHKAYNVEEEIVLSNREFELLYYLCLNTNQTITFEEIGKRMWGSYQEEDRRTIMVIASRLRKKLSSYIGMDDLIETVWSKGYKFVYHGKR